MAQRFLALLLVLGLADPARAGLSLIQVVQAQTSHGKEGLFGKTWVELDGRKMRLVSGTAEKVRKGEKAEEPARLIQLIDLDKKTRFILYPERKAYSKAPFGDLDSDDRLAKDLSRGKPVMRMVLQSAKLTKQVHTRMFLGTLCSHYRMRARFSLEAPDLKRREARMDQDVWVAPLSGPLSSTVLDLIAFENAYREATGGALTPIDHERYQLREAAAYLQVPEGSLHSAVQQLRDRFRDLPSYPVASSVSWWLPEEAPAPERPTATASPPPISDPRVQISAPGSLGSVSGPLRPAPGGKTGSPEDPVEVLKRSLKDHSGAGGGGDPQLPLYAQSGLGAPSKGNHREGPPRFKVINWHTSEKRLNRMYSRTRNQFAANFPFGPLKPRPLVRRAPPDPAAEPSVYPKFQSNLKETLDLLSDPAKRPAKPDDPPAPPRPPRSVPFYEIYAELHGLETAAEIPATDFLVPEEFAEIPYAPPT